METKSSAARIQENVTEASERFAGARTGVDRIVKNATERAGEIREKASEWMRENYGKTLGFTGLLVAAGLIGYFLGRNLGNHKSERVPQIPQ